jgi:hypothetical protein
LISLLRSQEVFPGGDFPQIHADLFAENADLFLRLSACICGKISENQRENQRENQPKSAGNKNVL